MRKYIMSLIILSLVFMLTSTNSFAYANGQKNECIKCHTLNKEQAKSIMTDMIPDIKVLTVEQAPVSGLWEIGFESGGRKNILYIDYSFSYVFAGNVFSAKTKTNLTEQSFLKINKVDISQIPLKNTLLMGEKNAKHKIFVFDDTD